MTVRAAPWWLGWMLAAALVSLFVGERVLGSVGYIRALFSGAGALTVLTCTVWRARSWRTATGDARRVQGWLLLAYTGVALALAGYLVSSEDGIRWLGIGFANEEARSRFRVAFHALWTTVLAVSLLPALGAQLAVGRHRGVHGGLEEVEAFRALETARAGLVVALAGATLLVLGYVVSVRDKTLDLSYFKTATPGPGTEAMVASLEEPLRVLLFFPDVSPVKDQVLRYFRALADASGQLRVEEHDRLASPSLAREHRIVSDGTVVLLGPDQRGRLEPGSTMAEARTFLRGLDREFQRALIPILRNRRMVYLTTGHGELNDTIEAVGTRPLGTLDAFREMMDLLGYEAVDLGVAGGLGSRVPDDAAAVAMLGPRRPFLDEEMDALVRYVESGGGLLIALDPGSDFVMEPLEAALGVRYVGVSLANDEQHLRQRGDASDRRLIITNRFSSHEAVTTLARAGPSAGVLFVNPGYLEATEVDPSPIFLVRALPSTFADVTPDFRFDEGTETRDSYPLVAAVETSVTTPGLAADSAVDSENNALEASTGDALEATFPGRALVYASTSPFTDAVLGSLGGNAALVADGVRWLAREEEISGPTETEEDVPIVHTQQANVIWFYSIILGAPTVVLLGGVLNIYHRRGRRSEA